MGKSRKLSLGAPVLAFRGPRQVRSSTGFHVAFSYFFFFSPAFNSDYKGKFVVLMFFPLAYTFVCPTEVVAFSDRVEEFRKMGAEVIGVSVVSICRRQLPSPPPSRVPSVLGRMP
ncbi:MAG: hypothetical protein BJ554DRAFT_2630 [Olpidium bornovanus]|uniref:Alkyl hydroperoxide reductase subunit C/ Thiol specific antioxidant domain-containing protein n=1 Tax=Olpidium bornovanus TaxID=278681 RepID=A0A8H8A1I3_9FUNG|nr:MAG: hypothetical protein BJ554DRAFT_2630 [Olpidium bornovanus]